MLDFVYSFFGSLALTLVVETVILCALSWWLLGKDVITRLGYGRIILVSLLASSLTLPYVWFVFPVIIYWSNGLALALSELYAFVIEAILYKFIFRVPLWRALLLSLLCNVGSFVIGAIIKVH